MKAGSLLALLVVIILMSVSFSGREEGNAGSSGNDTLTYNCYDIVSFHPELLTDGNLVWIEYLDDVEIINEQGDTVDARDGVGVHNIGYEVVHELETLRLCRPDSLDPQWKMKIPVTTYNELVEDSEFR